jgi:hypothetical protein
VNFLSSVLFGVPKCLLLTVSFVSKAGLLVGSSGCSSVLVKLSLPAGVDNFLQLSSLRGKKNNKNFGTPKGMLDKSAMVIRLA